MSRVHVVGVALVCAVMVAGCSGGSEATEPANVETPSLDISAVDEPLDVSNYVDDPCSLLDEDQRAQLDLPVAVATPRPASVCELTAAPGDASSVSVQILPRGLTEQYETWCLDPEKRLSECDTWTPRNINGYPAIQANIDSVPEWLCRLFLGVNDDTSISIYDNGIEHAMNGSNCDLTDKVAAMTLSSLVNA